jgi:hypothetical protein
MHAQLYINNIFFMCDFQTYNVQFKVCMYGF